MSYVVDCAIREKRRTEEEREKEGEEKRGKDREHMCSFLLHSSLSFSPSISPSLSICVYVMQYCVCVCVCVRVMERFSLCVCERSSVCDEDPVYVCVCV